MRFPVPKFVSLWQSHKSCQRVNQNQLVCVVAHETLSFVSFYFLNKIFNCVLFSSCTGRASLSYSVEIILCSIIPLPLS